MIPSQKSSAIYSRIYCFILILFILSSIIAEAKDQEKTICYIDKVFTKTGKRFVKVKTVEWFQGKKAKKIAREEHPEASDLSPNDYYISYRNSQKRTFPIADTARFVMETYSHKSDGNFRSNEKIKFYDFSRLFSKKTTGRFRQIPFWIIFSKGKIVKITEQYLP